MGAAVNTSALKSPTGIMKLVNLCLVIIVICLAKAGWKGNAVGHSVVDAQWLTSITTGAYVLILSVILFTYLVGDAVSHKMEAAFMFIGCILFLATGSLAIQLYQDYASGYVRDTGMALGSIAIITGIFMFVDVLLCIKAIAGK